MLVKGLLVAKCNILSLNSSKAAKSGNKIAKMATVGLTRP